MYTFHWNKMLVLCAVIGLLLYLAVALGPVLGGAGSFQQELGGTHTLSKQTAAQSAAAFVQSHSQLMKSKSYVLFNSFKDFSGYLQKEQLADNYDSKYSSKHPLTYYQVELVNRTADQQAFVNMNMSNGDVLGWTLPANPQAQPTPSAKAQKIAASFLKQQGYSVRQFTVIKNGESLSDGPTGAPVRVLDYESVKPWIGQSKMKISLQLQGSQIIAFHPLFTVPASYKNWFAGQSRKAQWMTSTNLIISLVMAVFAIIFASIYRKDVEFKRGIGLTLIYVVLSVINNLNTYPVLKMTIHDSAGMAMYMMVFLNAVTAFTGVGLYLSLTTGERMWRAEGYRIWPQWKESDFGQQVLNAMGRGYLLCLFIVGVQQLLYLIGDNLFHVWSIDDPQLSSHNMLWPWLFPLMAWVAGISEEGLYRVFGIILFKRLFRFNFLAILFPSIIWGLVHTEYPVYPVYTRLIEVTIIGIILGYTFLKYGYMTTLFAHASMDSLLMGLSMMTSSTGGGITAGQIILGLVYIASPALIGFVIAYAHGRFGGRNQPVSTT